MLADPQAINVTGTSVNAPRTGAGLNEGVFTSSDGNITLTVSHQFKKRNRHSVRVDLRKVAPDPLNAAQNLNYSMSAYVVMDVPQVGFSTAEIVTCAAGLFTNLTASTNANLTKVVGGEI